MSPPRSRSKRSSGSKDDAAQRRLAPYRAKRDFSVTAEPSGTTPPDSPGNRFVVQRHRARRLHYDLRLEAAGVLLSWAVPKGPTLDPEVKRMAVHVEDHPLDYFDFEGVIPAGSYGGGDVVVWDWGTWEPADGQDPLEALESGDLHFDLYGEKLGGRFVLVRRGKRKGDGKQARGAEKTGAGKKKQDDKEQWLLLHKHDEHAVAGWDPEEHPRSVKTGRTNDEVKAAPAATWSSASSWAAPTPDELEALDALGKAGNWQLGEHTLRLTNLDKVLFPAKRGVAKALTKRDLIRHHATVAPAMLPYLADRPINMHRYPDGIGEQGFWQKAAPSHAPEWLPRWRHEGAKRGRTEQYLVLDSPAALAWAANYGAIELHPWISTTEHPDQPTWAMIDIDPGTNATFDDAVVLARLFRTALEHLDVRAAPKVTGQRGIQIWVPVVGASFDDTRTWVEGVSRAVGDTVPEMVSWQWEKSKRGGRTRLDYTQNAVNKTLVAPFSARPVPGAPVSVPITWDELDDPDLRPDRWTVGTVGERLAEAGDPLAPLIHLDQRLPRL